MAADPRSRGRAGSGRVGSAPPPPGPDPARHHDPPLDAADYYRLLGVPYAASGAEIARAYRAAMKRIHPDRQAAAGDPLGRASAEEAARRLNRAYATLSKPLERQAYDRTIRAEIVQDQIMSRYVGGFHVPQASGAGGAAEPFAPTPRRAPTAAERRERQRADRDALVSLVAVFGGMALLLVGLLLLWAVVEAAAGALF